MKLDKIYIFTKQTYNQINEKTKNTNKITKNNGSLLWMFSFEKKWEKKTYFIDVLQIFYLLIKI